MPVFAGRHTYYLFEYIAECFHIGIADIVHHFIDRFATGFQLLFGCFYLYPLQVFEHGIRSGRFKPALKIPPAERYMRSDLIYRQLLLVVLFNEFLSFQDAFVIVLFVTLENDELRLAGAAHIEGKQLGDEDGDVAACLFLDIIQDQVKVRVSRPAGIDTVLIGEHLIVNDIDKRVSVAELVYMYPVCGTATAIKQARCAQQEGAGTQTHYFSALRKLIDDPGNEALVDLHTFEDVAVQGGNDDQVGFEIFCDQVTGVDAEEVLFQELTSMFAHQLKMKERWPASELGNPVNFCEDVVYPFYIGKAYITLRDQD